MNLAFVGGIEDDHLDWNEVTLWYSMRGNFDSQDQTELQGVLEKAEEWLHETYDSAAKRDSLPDKRFALTLDQFEALSGN